MKVHSVELSIAVISSIKCLADYRLYILGGEHLRTFAVK